MRKSLHVVAFFNEGQTLECFNRFINDVKSISTLQCHCFLFHKLFIYKAVFGLSENWLIINCSCLKLFPFNQTINHILYNDKYLKSVSFLFKQYS